MLSRLALLGFMNHIASSTSFTAAQRANASDAAKLLDGSASKAAWYDDYVNLDASDADNAFSLVNLQNTLTYMNAVNGIRRANGLSDMKVSIVSYGAVGARCLLFVECLGPRGEQRRGLLYVL